MSAPIRLVEETRTRSRAPLERRELIANLLVGAPLLAVAAVLVAGALDGHVDVFDVMLFVVAAVVMGRLQFETGSGFMNPGQLIFVPMLFVLPVAIVPLVVVAALLLDRVPEVLAGRLHPQRLLGAVCDAWFAVGPTIAFLIAGVSGPDWQDWPVYVLALGAQFACAEPVKPDETVSSRN